MNGGHPLLYGRSPKKDSVPDPDIEYDVAPTKEGQWRQEQLLAAGYDPVRSALLASERRVDLHQAVNLAKLAGPDLAFKIVW